MLRKILHNKADKLFFMLVFLSLLTGCNLNSQLFSSGLVKEWSAQRPVPYEALAMNPSYYFQGLGDDLGSLAWLAIPKGKLFQDARDEYKIRQIRRVLGEYLTLLKSLPDSSHLPEYQLVTIYDDLAGDYVDYLDGQVSMYAITNRLAALGPTINQLEGRLEEADNRRLTVLLQTFPSYVKLERDLQDKPIVVAER